MNYISLSHDIRGGKWKSFEKLWNIFHFHMILRVENGKVFLAMGQISTSTGSIEKLWNIFHMILRVENWKVLLAMGQISTSTPAQYWKKPLSSQQTQSVFIPEQLFSLIIYSETRKMFHIYARMVEFIGAKTRKFLEETSYISAILVTLKLWKEYSPHTPTDLGNPIWPKAHNLKSASSDISADKKYTLYNWTILVLVIESW